MKVAIRSKDGKTVSDTVSDYSGYLIYEFDGEKVIGSEFRKCSSSHSSEVRSIQDCDAVISKAIIPEEKENLQKRGKDVLITFKSSPEEALRYYLRQKNYFHSFIP
jgi:hypothetical protein